MVVVVVTWPHHHHFGGTGGAIILLLSFQWHRWCHHAVVVVVVVVTWCHYHRFGGTGDAIVMVVVTQCLCHCMVFAFVGKREGTQMRATVIVRWKKARGRAYCHHHAIV